VGAVSAHQSNDLRSNQPRRTRSNTKMTWACFDRRWRAARTSVVTERRVGVAERSEREVRTRFGSPRCSASSTIGDGTLLIAPCPIVPQSNGDGKFGRHFRALAIGAISQNRNLKCESKATDGNAPFRNTDYHLSHTTQNWLEISVRSERISVPRIFTLLRKHSRAKR
jgi:hypothetical protein